ncbi:hypothetical protein LZ30DRAFT_695150 [Colletotrichum cereale]|nr:hypothetical protein LZ30DRAFT_695150 [Colletotrichum cereale]
MDLSLGTRGMPLQTWLLEATNKLLPLHPAAAAAAAAAPTEIDYQSGMVYGVPNKRPSGGGGQGLAVDIELQPESGGPPLFESSSFFCLPHHGRLLMCEESGHRTKG